MNFNELKNFPTSINKVHESCYRSFNVLTHVKRMLDRCDSVETIKEYIDFAGSFEENSETTE